MPKISIIIPVYNAQNYIERCLDSVVNQTMQDIEIICVNDCSTDNSIGILNNYAGKYSNIKVIDCAVNAGESAARNIGIDTATGEYIAFLDNDDTIDSDFCEKLYIKARDTKADVCKGEVRFIDYDGKISYGKINETYKQNKNKMSFILNWWTAIYKRDFIIANNIKLLEGCILGGDSLFLNEAMILAKVFSTVDGVYYNYYRREDSGDSKILSFEKIQSALNIFELITKNINKSLNNNLISQREYDYVFKHWCYSCIILSMRNNDYECKNICAHMAVNLVNICLNPDYFYGELCRDYPSVYQYLKSKRADLLTDFLYANGTPFKFNMANIRSKHKLALEKNRV